MKFYVPMSLDRIANIEEHALRKEYSKMRAIANKRLKRLQKSDIAELSAATSWDLFPSLKELGNRYNIDYAYWELQRFLNLQTSTLSGTREIIPEIVENMTKKGIKVNSIEDIVMFKNFLQYVQSKTKDDIKYETVVELYNENYADVQHGGKTLYDAFTEYRKRRYKNITKTYKRHTKDELSDVFTDWRDY